MYIKNSWYSKLLLRIFRIPEQHCAIKRRRQLFRIHIHIVYEKLLSHSFSMHQNLADPSLTGYDPATMAALYEPPKPRFIFKMPRVVPDQKSKYESDELFRRLSRESEIRYTGYRERAIDERRIRFQNNCREGHAEISFVASGTNLMLIFNVNSNPYVQEPELDFERELGKVHLRSQFIMNGVCVRFRGWVHLERLDGVGCLEFDERRAVHEDTVLREQIESYQRRMNDSKRAYLMTPTPVNPHQRSEDVLRHMHNRGAGAVTGVHGQMHW